MRWRWGVTIAGIAYACAAVNGCSLDECSPGTTRCSGHLAQVCKAEDGTSFYNWETTDCGAEGRTCRQGTRGPECVFADRPCTASMCTGGVAIRCGSSGFVTGDQTCEADATCRVGGGDVACIYVDATCPSSGDDSFCAADGVTLFAGCSRGWGAPTYRAVCDGATPKCLEQNTSAICGG
jgi:hypothetical protein